MKTKDSVIYFVLLLLLLVTASPSEAGTVGINDVEAAAAASSTPLDEDESGILFADDGWEPPEFETDEEESAYYGPRDRFWRDIAKTKSLVFNGVDFYSKIEQCMDAGLTNDWDMIRRPQNLDMKVGERFIDELGEGPVFLVEIENAMSPVHAKAIRVLRDCVRVTFPHLYESRPMYQVYRVEETASEKVKQNMGGKNPFRHVIGSRWQNSDPPHLGNNPTHLNSIISIFLPDVVDELYNALQAAFDAAGWVGMVVRDELMGMHRSSSPSAFALPKDVGMRACEYLTYDGFDNLMEHTDGFASVVVLSLVLSDPSEYDGGEFYITDDLGETHFIKPKNKNSAIFFLGGTYKHGVSKLSGQREALSAEFWYYPDLPFGSNLCSAEARNMEDHVLRCNEAQFNLTAGTVDFDIPCDLEFPSYSIYGVCQSFSTKKDIYTKSSQEAVNDEL